MLEFTEIITKENAEKYRHFMTENQKMQYIALGWLKPNLKLKRIVIGIKIANLLRQK